MPKPVRKMTMSTWGALSSRLRTLTTSVLYPLNIKRTRTQGEEVGVRVLESIRYARDGRSM